MNNLEENVNLSHITFNDKKFTNSSDFTLNLAVFERFIKQT